MKKLLFFQMNYMKTDIEYIIKHEFMHCKEKDVQYKALFLIINIIHWFNPLVWMMRTLVERDVELLCDDKVLKSASKEEKQEYSEVIMSCIETGKDKNRKNVLTTSYSHDTKFIKWRFLNILDEHNKKDKSVMASVTMLILIFASGIIQLREGTIIYPLKEIPIDAGFELRTDIDGNGNMERVYVSDNVSGTNAFTQISAQFENGNIVFIDYPDYWSSYLVAGDLSGNGAADIVVVRISTGSTYGGGVVSIIHFEEEEWIEYPSTFIENKSLNMEQPDNFSPDNWTVSCLGATIIEKENATYLRLILNEDIGNDIVKSIDCSYQENGWYIEDIQIIDNYFAESKGKMLLNNPMF